MPSFVPLSKTEHASQGWRRPSDYAFAAQDATVPIVAFEVAEAALSMPLAFVRADGMVQLVAMLSTVSGRNGFVAPNGAWLGSYVPALLRAFPFRLGRLAEEGELALCLAAEACSGPDQERIFDLSGDLSPRVRQIASFLSAFEQARQQAGRAGDALDRAGVLVPWKVNPHDDVTTGEVAVAGLWRVDEEALSALSDERFLDLRKIGALGIAHAQVLSTSRLDVLERLARLSLPKSDRARQTKPGFLHEEGGNLGS